MRFRYQLDVVDRIAEKLNSKCNAKTSRLNPNCVSIKHSNSIQRVAEDAAIIQEKYDIELDILHDMRMDLMRLITQINDNVIATYLIMRYCREQDVNHISDTLNHTVKWLDSKAAEALDLLLKQDCKTVL